MLNFLHGFLGSPQDWDDVIAHLSGYRCTALSYPFKLPSSGILIGYSMGGRIALSSPLPKILISTHPGLSSPEEKALRLTSDQIWIDKLQTLSLPEFLTEWYAQSLFDSLRAHPSFPNILERRLKQDPATLLHQLKSHFLSQQTFQKKGLFVHGAHDGKFKFLYDNLQIPSLEIPDAGHACHLENPQEVAKIILNHANLIN